MTGTPKERERSSRFRRRADGAAVKPARVPQDELDFVTRDADIARLTVGKLRQLAALPRSFGRGQAVAGVLAPPLRHSAEAWPNKRESKFG